MTTSSKLSVAIPSYNQGRFVGQTVESLLEQSFAPAQIVISDNHSDDETGAVLKRFGTRIRVVRPPKHLPMYSHNWNHVVAGVETEWTAMLSSDDLALPNYVETLERAIARRSSAVLVGGGWTQMDAGGRDLPSRPRVCRLGVLEPPENFLQSFDWEFPRFGAAAFRTDGWREVGGFPEKFAAGCDWAMWLLLAPLGPFAYEPEVIFRYRTGSKSDESERRRLLGLAEDLVYTYGMLIPKLAEKLGIADHPEIGRFSRLHCYRMLVRAGRILEREDRSRFIDVVRSWADECGLRSELGRIEAGKRLPRKQYGPVRMFASDTAELLKSLRPR